MHAPVIRQVLFLETGPLLFAQRETSAASRNIADDMASPKRKRQKCRQRRKGGESNAQGTSQHETDAHQVHFSDLKVTPGVADEGKIED
jgi:hypothetical protein